MHLNESLLVEDFIHLLHVTSVFTKESIKKVYSITKSFDKTVLAIKIALKFNCDLIDIAEAMKE